MNEKDGFFITTMTHIHCIYNAKPERKMKKGWCKLKTCVKLFLYFERNIGFMVYMMMNWLWKQVGVWVKFESRNPPISLRHANSLSMSNFNVVGNSLKKFQHWPIHKSLLPMSSPSTISIWFDSTHIPACSTAREYFYGVY